MLLRILYALGVWVIVALVCMLVGGLLQSVSNVTAAGVGNFLTDNGALIGFLAGLAHFIWGSRAIR